MVACPSLLSRVLSSRGVSYQLGCTSEERRAVHCTLVYASVRTAQLSQDLCSTAQLSRDSDDIISRRRTVLPQLLRFAIWVPAVHQISWLFKPFRSIQRAAA